MHSEECTTAHKTKPPQHVSCCPDSTSPKACHRKLMRLQRMAESDTHAAISSASQEVEHRVPRERDARGSCRSGFVRQDDIKRLTQHARHARCRCQHTARDSEASAQTGGLPATTVAGKHPFSHSIPEPACSDGWGEEECLCPIRVCGMVGGNGELPVLCNGKINPGKTGQQLEGAAIPRGTGHLLWEACYQGARGLTARTGREGKEVLATSEFDFKNCQHSLPTMF
jgi:hypothetical protein